MHKGTNGLDPRFLANFIHELNIARRHVAAYPGDHPIIVGSVDKVLLVLQKLLVSRQTITIGITWDALMFGATYLERSNLVYRNLARLLFGLGIAALTINSNISRADLLNFLGVIALKREQIEAQGGIASFFPVTGCSGIQIRSIDYLAFHATEEEVLDPSEHALAENLPDLIWRNFTHTLCEGSLGHDEGRGGRPPPLDPVHAAELFNQGGTQQTLPQDGQDCSSYEHAITLFLQQLEKADQQEDKEKLLQWLSSFIYHLSPELRPQFLNSTLLSLATHQEFAEPILSLIPGDAIIEALNDLDATQTVLPQTLLDLIGRILDHQQQRRVLLDEVQPKSVDAITPLQERLKDIFREESRDDPLLDACRQTAIKSRAGSSDLGSDPRVDLAEIEELKQSLTGHSIEQQISRIVLDMRETPLGADRDASEILQRTLLDLCSYFLSMGDFATLDTIHHRLLSYDNPDDTGSRSAILESFSRPEFVEEVLNGLAFWGKSNYEVIATLTARIGEPFIDPLLDRLAEEQSMSLRRYYMARLLEIGRPIIGPVLARFRDSRWYFIRNLVLLLRNLGDPEAIPPIRRLANHPHPKVRQEAVRTLFALQDSEADGLLLRDLANPDRGILLPAVRMAENSQNPEVLKRLIEFLGREGLGAADYELKSATLTALGVIANPAALPEIERLFRSRSLLRSGQLNRLKAEAVKSLRNYPARDLAVLHKNLAQAKQSDLQQLAEEIRRTLSGETNGR